MAKKREYPEKLQRLEKKYKDPNRWEKKTEVRPKVMLLPEQHKKYKLHKEKLNCLKNKGVQNLNETEILRRCLLKLSDDDFLKSLDYEIDKIKC